MSDATCSNPECTIAQTGLCLLDHPEDECPNRLETIASDMDFDVSPLLDEPVLPTPDESPRFPSSAALGLQDVRALRGRSYGRIIGVLGAPDSGKTACLVSLYLLLAHDRLDGFSFADSKSLMAFDQLSRGARSWQDGVPDQMTAHTELGNGRSAGFLHLKLVRKTDGCELNLFVPDLPGEWSTNLIEKDEGERLSFLRDADTIWLTIDGRSLTENVQRRGAIHRLALLIERVAELVKPNIPMFRLVVTRSDQGQPLEETMQEIQSTAKKLGVDIAINLIASFSQSKDIRPGTGIANLIAESVATPINRDDFWPDAEGLTGYRSSLRISTEDNR